MTHTATIRTPSDAARILDRATAWVRRRVADGRAVVLTLDEEARSLPQNALLHALLTDVARSHDWAGARRSVEVWKRLFVAAWLRARGESVELLPALDGHGVDIVFRRTSKMTKAEVAELIDYIDAWRAMNEPATAKESAT